MKPLIEIKPLLNLPGKRILITMHQKPDADAMGASLAMYRYLSRKGHTVFVVSPTNYPDFLKWMPGCSDVLDFSASQEKVLPLLKDLDLLFCLDFNVLSRTKAMEPLLQQLTCAKVMLDHHPDPQPDFEYGISDTRAASTSLLVYEFIKEMGDRALIDDGIAQCVYAGTMTDTGSFRFPNTNARVHLMVADLMQGGLKHEPIHQAIYDNFLENRLRFLGHLLSNRLEVFYEYNAALIWISSEDARRYDLKTGDTEGLVNYPLSIQGIQLSALIVDRGDEVKLSFRSKGAFDVNAFARKYFQGGGHPNASGGHSKDSIEATIRRYKQALEENKKLLQ